VRALPVLYSFRRCPYAIRARLALAAAGLRPGVDLAVREVSLKARPPELLAASPKGTVPVLVSEGGTVLAESLAIMHWALRRADPGGGWAGRSASECAVIEALIQENDGPFKHHLDRFKYPDRYPGEASGSDRLAGLAILGRWNARLAAGWRLAAGRSPLPGGPGPAAVCASVPPGGSRWGLMPSPASARCRLWLQRFLASPQLAAVMEAPWGLRQCWRSPRLAVSPGPGR